MEQSEDTSLEDLHDRVRVQNVQILKAEREVYELRRKVLGLQNDLTNTRMANDDKILKLTEDLKYSNSRINNLLNEKGELKRKLSQSFPNKIIAFFWVMMNRSA